MPITPPSLDDRSFDDLVNEVVARIPAHTPEWTNPRLGDPGRTLIELFAWLTDTLLYRVNLIPERQRLAFLRLVGVQMRPAVPARGLVTVGFDDKQSTGIQVMQPLARLKGPVNFESTSEITILPVAGEAYYKRALSCDEKAAVHDLLPGLVQLYGISGTPKPYATTPVFPGGVPIAQGFDLMASVDHSLWIALVAAKENVGAVRQSIGSQALSVGLAPAIEIPVLFEDIGPRGRIPHVWQITTSDKAHAALLNLDVIADSTAGLRQRGVERLLLPSGDLIGAPSSDVRQNLNAGVGATQPPRIDDPEKAATIVAWLRLQPTVRMRTLAMSWAGVNALQIEQLETLTARVVGQSDGTASQEMALPATSVEAASLVLQVEETGRGFVTWQQVTDLAAVGRDFPAYRLDSEAGAVCFGDGMRGKIPELQRRVRAAFMRAGGGLAGNLAAGSLAEIAGLDATGKSIVQKLKVAQTQPTSGGDDAETLAAAEQRIPSLFRNRERAVTELDYKQLALQAPGTNLGRVELLSRFKPQQRQSDVPGVVSVMVVPAKSPVGPPNPRADRPTLEAVYEYLADRKPIATELYVIGCEYIPLSLTIGVMLLDGVSRETALAQIADAARMFLWPLAGGGTDRLGWKPGRSVRDRELDAVIARVPGVDAVNGVNLFIKPHEKHIPGAGVQEDAVNVANPFVKADNLWQLVQRHEGCGPAEIPLEIWQLPELLHVLVVTGEDPPTSLDGLVDDPDNGVAVPVIPKTC